MTYRIIYETGREIYFVQYKPKFFPFWIYLQDDFGRDVFSSFDSAIEEIYRLKKFRNSKKVIIPV